MKKSLTWICSLLLAASVTGMSASAPKAGKVHAAGSPAKTMKLTADNTKSPTRIITPKRRPAANGATNGLSRRAYYAPAPLRFAKKGPLFAAANLPQLYGTVILADDWDNNAHPNAGLCKLPTKAGEDFTLVSDKVAEYQFGGVARNGVYYITTATEFFGQQFYLSKGVDMATGEEVYNKAGDSPIHVPVSQTYSATDDKIYAVCYNEDMTGLIFATMEYGDNGPETYRIADFSANLCALAADAQGQLYGITRVMIGQGESATCTASYLVKIDKTNGSTTVVGETGMFPQYISDATIDPESGRMFWAVAPADLSGYLAEVNLSTGEATRILDFKLNEEVVGLVKGIPAADDKAPAAVSNLTANFPNGQLSGSLDFKAPATLFDGTAATGSLSYTVTLDGEVKATGTTSFNATVSVPMTFTMMQEGVHTFAAWVTNAIGDSPKSEITTFIGSDQPKAPANVRLTYENGKMNISWDAVTEGIAGGYVNPSEVSYMVQRKLPTFSMVEFDTEALTSSETITEPEGITQYCYQVVAKCNGQMSPAGMSNVVTLGSIIPPYNQNFNADTALEGFTILDENNDGKIWTLDDGHARMSYNANVAMDDWLITPPMRLEAGKSYEVSLRAWSQSLTFTERMEVKYGNEATPQGMTETLLAPTVLDCTLENPTTFTWTIRPTATGTYYIGIHGISDKDCYYLNIDDLQISEGVKGDAPDMPVLKVTPDPNGTTVMTVNVTAPTKTLDGDPLSSLEKIEIYRDESLIKTLSPVTKGETYTFTDDPGEVGTYSYSTAAFNASGKGKPASTSVFCGIDLPATPTNLNLVETANPGEVTVSWDAVTTDQNGNTINPSNVTYSIFYFEGQTPVAVKENISGTSHTFRAIEEGDQDFFQYAVYANTARGQGQGAMTPMIAAGTPYDGMAESFADASITYAFGLDGSDGAQFSLLDDTMVDGATSQDGDNGFIGCTATFAGGGCDLFTGKINLGEMTAPSLTFWAFTIAEDDTNYIEVFVREVGGEYTSLYRKELQEMGFPGWNKGTVSLDAYAGKVVQIMFRCKIVAYKLLLMDNIRVGSMFDNDLNLMSIQAPSKIKTGAAYMVDVTVVNDGRLDAEGHTVELYADGTLIETRRCEPLAAGSKEVFTFPRTMSDVAENDIEYHAVVTHSADQDLANNTSTTITVSPIISKLPAPEALTGKLTTEGGAELSWNEPNLAGDGILTVEEDFESGESFAKEFEGWTFLDLDEAAVGGFQNTEIPGIEPGETLASFFVFDANKEVYPQFNESYAAHSGTKYLAALFDYEDGTTNDWAISPRLSGKAQTISFYARSYSEEYPEKIEMLYSKGSLLTKDFVKVRDVASVPGSWTLYEFDIPQGADYFAIRSCGTASFMLLLDDFTYESDGGFGNLELKGYNVYRNGDKITKQPVTERTYTDLEGPNQENAYRVAAVYATGISRGSNEVRLITSGLDAVTAGVEIATTRGMILVSGADGMRVTIYSLEGKTLFSADGKASMTIPVSAGVYLVKAGGTVAKVLVK